MESSRTNFDKIFKDLFTDKNIIQLDTLVWPGKIGLCEFPESKSNDLAPDNKCTRWCRDRGLGPPKYYLNHGIRPTPNWENTGNADPTNGLYFNAFGTNQVTQTGVKAFANFQGLVCKEEGEPRFNYANKSQVGENLGTQVAFLGLEYDPSANNSWKNLNPSDLFFTRTPGGDPVPEIPLVCSACTHINQDYIIGKKNNNGWYIGGALPPNNETGVCCCDSEPGWLIGPNSPSPQLWKPDFGDRCDL